MKKAWEQPEPARVDPEIADLVPLFLENRRKEVPRLRQALAESDLDTIEDLGHGMKGMGTAYGFEPVSRIGAELERLARGGAPGGDGEVATLIDGLDTYLQRVEWTVDSDAG